MTSPSNPHIPVTSSVVALKPCPFCGNADIQPVAGDSPFSIRCTNCCAEMPYMSLDDPQAERWNTRTTPEAADALVEKVMKLIGQRLCIIWYPPRDRETFARDLRAILTADKPERDHG